MITNLIELNEFIVLIEESNETEPTIETCSFEYDTVGIAFYGSGKVEFEISGGGRSEIVLNKRGTAISFIGNNKTKFTHKISPHEPLRSVTIFSLISNIKKLPQPERDVYERGLEVLLKSKNNFTIGPSVYMTYEMLNIISKVFQNNYEGMARVLFLKSQAAELLSHFFSLLTSTQKSVMNEADTQKIYMAKEILTKNIEKPPSLSELSQIIGLNSNKLKKSFKEMFGVPVFKYLQNERLTKAYAILRQGGMNVQETAWFVGYESLSSFSNAFYKKFGSRPSDIKSFSNKF